ncbi:MAG: helix-turn-helix transcriptional regulator [Bacteroidaceae bacterium]|nr:helix-turn-helix transcriptional regulator [Bacteroidaceae bacterium]
MQFMTDVMEKLKKRYTKMLGSEPPFFVDNEYSIERFAADLGTNRSYASKFTNNILEVSFPALLNKLRLAHFIRMKQELPHTPIKTLAERCGFKNSFSFRRAFKNEYGVTASEYFKKE